MKAHMKRGWRALGLGALALLFVATLAAGGRSPGPSLAAPGPEAYHIYDGRAGIQTEASVINAARSVEVFEDPQYIGPVIEILFGKSPTMTYTELYDHNGYVLSKSTNTQRYGVNVDAVGNVVGENRASNTFHANTDPMRLLYSYQRGIAAVPWWLSQLQQN